MRFAQVPGQQKEPYTVRAVASVHVDYFLSGPYTQDLRRFLRHRAPDLSSGPVWTRWSRWECPSGSTLVYQGFAAGDYYEHSGSGMDRRSPSMLGEDGRAAPHRPCSMLSRALTQCMPADPEYLDGTWNHGDVDGSLLYRVHVIPPAHPNNPSFVASSFLCHLDGIRDKRPGHISASARPRGALCWYGMAGGRTVERSSR